MVKIYVSSTYKDLIEHRKAVYETLRELRCDVIAMEDYVATDVRPVEKCLADVSSCNIYVGIFAWRYGYIPPDSNPENISITELEYRKAKEVGIPRLIFLLDENQPWPPNLIDENRDRIKILRHMLSAERLPGWFGVPDNLARKVSVAVQVTRIDESLLPGAIAIGRSNPNTTIEVSLKLRRKKALPALTGRPATGVTREELANVYGASQADINKVIETFTKSGLKPVFTNQTTRTVRLRGSIAVMEEAFQVKLLNYAQESESYRGRVGSVHLPTDIKNIVAGVFVLDNRPITRRSRPVRKVERMASVPSAWYIPSELASHYNFPAGDGNNQTVGLLEFAGGYFEEDLKEFCRLANISTPPKVTAVSTDGTPTNTYDDTARDVMLDIEVVAGICPKANIVAQDSEQGWITALDAAVHDQINDPGVLSVSRCNAEDTYIWTSQAMVQVNETLQEAAQLDVTVCVSAGDDGSSDAVPDEHVHVEFPSSSPYVLSVGGTAIQTKGGWQPDIVWKDGNGLTANLGGSTGGGVSAVFPRPDWQKSIPVRSVDPGAIVGRCVPDLAANADPNTYPYLVVVGGKIQGVGGTSAATSLVAGLLTLINAKRPAGKRVGYLTPVLYQTSGGGTVGSVGCTDVTSGNNDTATAGGYSAGPGYDAVSGWGTPNGKKLAQAIAGTIQ